MDKLFKAETGANGFKYCAFIRDYGDQYCAYIESDDSPLYRGAAKTTREEAQADADRMMAVYTRLSA